MFIPHFVYLAHAFCQYIPRDNLVAFVTILGKYTIIVQYTSAPAVIGIKRIKRSCNV